MTEHNPQNTEQTENEALPETRPRIFFSSMTFQDGTEIRLGNNDIIVFVGGNNTGKSQTLRDLESLLTGEGINKSIINAETNTIGTPDNLLRFIKDNSFHKKEEQSGNIIEWYTNYGFNFGFHQGQFEQFVAHQWNTKQFGSLKGLFCRRIQTEKRIVDSNQADSFPARKQAPSTAIQFLFKNAHDEKRISRYFDEAFGQELIVDRGALSEIPLLVGKNISPQEGELLTDESYGKRLSQNTSPLEEQGDGMRSFASVILQTLAYRVLSILLLDEPEAFLHPPQAKILGRLLAKERPRDAQLFIATHSGDILMGLLEAAPKNLRIIRLNRNSNRYAVELNKDKAKEIMDDPFLRHSKILSALFYKRVMICEAEADCLFYQVILEATGIANISDTLFLPAGGKDKLYKLAAILKALHIPVDVIADLDILNDGGGRLEQTIRTLGNEKAWTEIEPLWKDVKSAIEQQKGLKSSEQVEQEIHEALKKLKNKKASFPDNIDKEIRLALKNASPWGYTKTQGKSVIPHGEPMEKWQKLQKICAEIGLWIVPVGELESFCATETGHGSEWVQNVLSHRDLKAKELQEAREFISAVWDNKPEELN